MHFQHIFDVKSPEQRCIYFALRDECACYQECVLLASWILPCMMFELSCTAVINSRLQRNWASFFFSPASLHPCTSAGGCTTMFACRLAMHATPYSQHYSAFINQYNMDAVMLSSALKYVKSQFLVSLRSVQCRFSAITSWQKLSCHIVWGTAMKKLTQFILFFRVWLSSFDLVNHVTSFVHP